MKPSHTITRNPEVARVHSSRTVDSICDDHPEADPTPHELVALICRYSERKGHATRVADIYCLSCSLAWLRRRTAAVDLTEQAARILERA